MKTKFRIKVWSIPLYLLLLPFFVPRGPYAYLSGYKSFFTYWLYVSMLGIVWLFIYSIVLCHTTYKKCINYMLLYSASFIFITILTKGTLDEGLQKLFMAPMLCLLCAIYLHQKPVQFIDTISDILVCIFGLNCFIFNSFFWPNYFGAEKHLLFLGHVQIASQLGILGVLISYILLKLEFKKKSRILLFLSIITMIISKTSASFVTLFVLLIFYVLSKSNSIVSHYKVNWKMIVLGFAVLNVLFWVLVSIHISDEFGAALSVITNGRSFVWREVINLMQGHWMVGYGAYGVLIRVFWHEWSSTPEGMNYAHSEMLQRLLDGGIVLLVLFILFVHEYLKNIKDIHNKRSYYWISAIVVVLLTIMIFESVTEYYYFFIIISIIAYIPEIERKREKIEIQGSRH